MHALTFSLIAVISCIGMVGAAPAPPPPGPGDSLLKEYVPY